jgi:hypothetical protein
MAGVRWSATLGMCTIRGMLGASREDRREGRLRRCRGSGLCGDWDGHGGVDSRAGGAVRLRGTEADAWTGVEPGSDSAVVVARSRGASGRDGGGCGVVLQAIAGYDAGDVTSVDVPVADYVSALREGAKGMRVGVVRGYFFDDVDAEVASAMEHALRGIQSLGAELREVRFGDVPTDRTVQAAESYAFHAENVAKSAELYQAETVRRIRSGEKISAADYIQRRRDLEEARRKYWDGVCRCGCAGDSDYADGGAGDCGLEGESGRAASGGAEAAAQYAAVQCVGTAGDLSALRIYAERTAHRDADLRGRTGGRIWCCG